MRAVILGSTGCPSATGRIRRGQPVGSRQLAGTGPFTRELRPMRAQMLPAELPATTPNDFGVLPQRLGFHPQSEIAQAFAAAIRGLLCLPCKNNFGYSWNLGLQFPYSYLVCSARERNSRHTPGRRREFCHHALEHRRAIGSHGCSGGGRRAREIVRSVLATDL